MMDTHINEKTSISLFAVVVSLPVLVAVTVTLAAISNKSDANAARIDANERKIEKQTSLLLEIRDNVIRIEETLKRKR